MSEQKSGDAKFAERLRQFHVACVSFFEKNRAFQDRVVPMMQGVNPAANARKPFNCLRELKATAQLVVGLAETLKETLQDFGIKRGWEIEVSGGVEPGWHLMTARIARFNFVESKLARAIDERRWDRRVTCADFSMTSAPERVGDLHWSLYITSNLRRGDERSVLALKREFFELKELAPANATAPSADARGDVIVLDHEMGKIEAQGGQVVMRVKDSQMDFLVLCALATLQRTSFRTRDFFKLGRISNASGVYVRLKKEVKDLIEKSKDGWRLRGMPSVIHPRALPSKWSVNWKTLEVSLKS